MNTVFNDMQDQSSPLDGAVVRNRRELLALFAGFENREPFGGELVGDNGNKQTLGIGKDVGFVQHSPSDGNTSYMVAVAKQPFWKQEYAEFLVGDTLSPISQRFCLPIEMVKEIAARFVETGERSTSVDWEEI